MRRHAAAVAAIVLGNAVALAQNPPVKAVAIGSESREDDWPSIAAAPDGSLWAAWLSFSGDRDDIGLRRFQGGVWQNVQWVPGVSGDAFLPQVAVDASNRVWVAWSQQVRNNWDIYARRFDPGKQEWSALERLTSDPLPDINPRLAQDGKGRFALVWQGFRGRHSRIFLKTFDGKEWSAEVQVAGAAANHWEPSAAIDGNGTVWVAFDGYRGGNYDVYLAQVRGGAVAKEMAVAATSRMEARATVAVDGSGRVWVAWEEGQPNWGKDQGYVIRAREPGVVLGGKRTVRVRCYDGIEWREPEDDVAGAFPFDNLFQPLVFTGSNGTLWVAAKIHTGAATGQVRPKLSYYEYWLTRLDKGGWRTATAVPNSKGRSSTRMNAAVAGESIWLAWPTDNRAEPYYHRPRRHEVYAASIGSAGGAPRPAWKTAVAAAPKARAGHADEKSDIEAIRSKTVVAGGQTYRIYRGDFHRHTELSWDGTGSTDGSLQDFYRYMIDAAGMDFGASTDHQGGYHPYWWWYSQKMSDMYHAAGAYVPVYGFERSVAYPDGHRNVFFARRSESRVIPFFVRQGLRGFELPLGPVGQEPTVNTGREQVLENDTRLLYEEVRARNAISIPHTSGTNQGTDWRDNDPAVEPVVEIFQGCRTSYEAVGAPLAAAPGDGNQVKQFGYFPEGMVSNAWAKGYRLGVIASSDHSSTHISYAMVLAGEFTREGILDAIRKRHTYGAMDNILLDVRMGGRIMGDEFEAASAVPLRLEARGTRPIARAEVIKDNKVVYSVEPKLPQVQFEYLDRAAAPGRHFYYVRLQQDDGALAWSSPIWATIR